MTLQYHDSIVHGMSKLFLQFSTVRIPITLGYFTWTEDLCPFLTILYCSFLLGSWGSNEGALSGNVRGFCKAIPDKLRWGIVLKCSVRHCFSSFFFLSISETNFELSSALTFSKQFWPLQNRTAANYIWIITPGR